MGEVTVYCKCSSTRPIFPRLRVHVSRNPGGIRFGSAEIYQILDLCFSPAAALERSKPDEIIVDSLVVGQMINKGTDERVILFLQLPFDISLEESLVKRVKEEIRKRRSPRHVPVKVRATLSEETQKSGSANSNTF